MKEQIYLDYAATTPVDEDVFEAARPYYTEIFYNPSSSHFLGQKAFAAVEKAREKCALAINCHPDEIYFTSGGAESINWALGGVGGGIAVSAIEHDSALEKAKMLSKSGTEVTYVMPDKDGIITPEALHSAATDKTRLVCVMTVNNIVGSIQPIKELARVAH